MTTGWPSSRWDAWPLTEEKTERLEVSHDTFSRNTRIQLQKVFEALRELMTPPDPPKRPIGFVTPEEKKKPPRKKR